MDEELGNMEEDPRWSDWLDEAHLPVIEGLSEPATDGSAEAEEGFDDWAKTNVYKQRQEGFVAVTVNLPLGDITSRQARKLADMMRRFAPDAMRTTVDQNFFLRWIHEQDLVALYNDLYAAKLVLTGAGTIADVTACPGTDTCKLGIASSRGLGAEVAGPIRGPRASLRSGSQGYPRKGEWVPELMRDAPYRRHRLLRIEPERGRISRFHTSSSS